MALFITFEGGEGSGKSTQANILLEKLRKQKESGASFAEEPGTTLLGRQVREWLRGHDRPLIVIPGRSTQLSLPVDYNGDNLPAIYLHAGSPREELLAFTLARSQLVEDYILPKLKGKNVVICNRYADSTTAYQGYGRRLDLKLVEMANNIATQGLKPDLTILLDIPPEKGVARKFGAVKKFEREELEFHQRVRKGYLKLAAAEPQRWLVIDATQDKETLAAIIWKKVRQLLPSRRG
ncbi:dTMP kinase [Chloroflexota bacterium]